MNLWLELVQLASTISFAKEEDSLIWQFNSNGVYSSQSLYKIINFKGVIPLYVQRLQSGVLRFLLGFTSFFGCFLRISY